MARDNTQILFNAIWELPTERIEEAIVARLPVPTTVLPRSLPVPKPRPLTNWEQFAKEKGIVKKKKGPVFNETLQVCSKYKGPYLNYVRHLVGERGGFITMNYS